MIVPDSSLLVQDKGVKTMFEAVTTKALVC